MQSQASPISSTVNTMGLEHFTRDAAEKLDDLAAQNSPIEAGRYVVKHAEEARASARDDQIQSMVWFKTPASSPSSDIALDATS